MGSCVVLPEPVAADDHDLMGRDGARDLLPPGADGQILRIGDDGNGPLGTVRRRGAFGAFGAFCTFAALGAFSARARGTAPPDAGASGLLATGRLRRARTG